MPVYTDATALLLIELPRALWITDKRGRLLPCILPEHRHFHRGYRNGSQ